MINLKDPGRIEIELTSKCTLECSLCPRTLDSNETITRWKFGELNFTAVERLITQTVNTKSLILGGGHGDPIYYSRLFDVIKLAHQHNINVHLETAANLRPKEWWQELASIIKRNDTINFSVDGLEHNNHMYRKNAVWSSIQTAMSVIGTESKCNTIWKWILFRYNENDIVEGYKLSKQLGIREFRLVESGRIPIGMKPTKTYQQAIDEIKNYKASLSHQTS